MKLSDDLSPTVQLSDNRGEILELPPVEQIMASQQVKSRYMEHLISRKQINLVRIATGAMSAKLCPKIILEGTRLTLKTEIAFALNEHPRIVGPRKYRYHSPLVSAEWCGFTNFPWGRGLINFEPREEELAMEAYRTWLHLFELLKYYSWIVDRFHLSTKLYQFQAHGRSCDFRWLEEQLLQLGFRHVFCYRQPESFAAAREERIKISGKPSQYDNLDVFIREQERMKDIVERSMLPHLALDVSDNDVTGAAGRIADWMEASGGLYIRES